MKLTQKQKNWIIGSAVGVCGATAIIAPLAVVNFSNVLPKYMDEYDQEFGVSIDTYNNMKDEIRSSYKKKLEDMWISPEQVEAKMSEVQNEIDGYDLAVQESFHTSFNTANDETRESIERNVNYTDATTALAKYAHDKLGIHPARPSNVSWTLMDNQYNSLRSSMEQFMNSSSFSTEEIQKTLKAGDRRFAEIKTQAQAEYPTDSLTGVSQSITQVNECFASINKLVAFQAAEDKLKEFSENYSFTYRDASHRVGKYANIDNTYFSKLIQENIHVGSEIKENYFNEIFVCTNKITGEPVDFSPTMIKGYKLSPVLHAREMDKTLNFDDQKENFNAVKNEEEDTQYTNTYSLTVDWTIVCDLYPNNHPYMNSNDYSMITAQLRTEKPNVGSLTKLAKKYTANGTEETDAELMALREGTDVKYTTYSLKASNSAIRDSLIKSYANNVYFQWDAPENIPYEGWWSFCSNPSENGLAGLINDKTLAAQKLQIGVRDPDTGAVSKLTPLSKLLERRVELDTIAKYWQQKTGEPFDPVKDIEDPLERFIFECDVFAYIDCAIDDAKTDLYDFQGNNRLGLNELGDPLRIQCDIMFRFRQNEETKSILDDPDAYGNKTYAGHGDDKIYSNEKEDEYKGKKVYNVVESYISKEMFLKASDAFNRCLDVYTPAMESDTKDKIVLDAKLAKAQLAVEGATYALAIILALLWWAPKVNDNVRLGFNYSATCTLKGDRTGFIIEEAILSAATNSSINVVPAEDDLEADRFGLNPDKWAFIITVIACSAICIWRSVEMVKYLINPAEDYEKNWESYNDDVAAYKGDLQTRLDTDLIVWDEKSDTTKVKDGNTGVFPRWDSSLSKGQTSADKKNWYKTEQFDIAYQLYNEKFRGKPFKEMKARYFQYYVDLTENDELAAKLAYEMKEHRIDSDSMSEDFKYYLQGFLGMTLACNLMNTAKSLVVNILYIKHFLDQGGRGAATKKMMKAVYAINITNDIISLIFNIVVDSIRLASVKD